VSLKAILAHRCNRANLRGGPPDCRCRKKLTAKKAAELVDAGEAAWRETPEGRRDPEEIVFRRIPLPPLMSRTIGAPEIRRAFINGVETERARIEFYREVH
jgi:hypothetical protein